MSSATEAGLYWRNSTCGRAGRMIADRVEMATGAAFRRTLRLRSSNGTLSEISQLCGGYFV